MQGLLSDGDTVMIDHRRSSLEGEAVYVIRLDDHLYAKRLQRQFDGSIHIISENKAYRDMIVPKEQLNDLEIIGRCSGQLIPDTVLSFSSAFAGASPSLN